MGNNKKKKTNSKAAIVDTKALDSITASDLSWQRRLFDVSPTLFKALALPSSQAVCAKLSNAEIRAKLVKIAKGPLSEVKNEGDEGLILVDPHEIDKRLVDFLQANRDDFAKHPDKLRELGPPVLLSVYDDDVLIQWLDYVMRISHNEIKNYLVTYVYMVSAFLWFNNFTGNRGISILGKFQMLFACVAVYGLISLVLALAEQM